MNKELSKIHASKIRQFHDKMNQYKDRIDFTIGDPFDQADDEIIDEAVNSLKKNDTHYCENQGWYELRKQLSEKEIYYAADEILITSGATQGLFETCMTLLNEKDGVLVPLPCYPSYLSLLTLLKCDIQTFELDENYQISIEKIKIKENTKAILINHPHNPTGTVLNKKSIKNLQKLILENNLYCIWDATYYEMNNFESLYHFSIHDQIISINSFSKKRKMSGFRVGYVCAEQKIIQEMIKIHQLIQSSLPLFVQKAACKSLDLDYCKYEEQKKYIITRLKKMNLKVIENEGPFYVYFHIGKFGMSSDRFAELLLEEQHVGVLSGSCFYDQNHIRMSCCIELEKCRKGCDRLETFVKKYENI